MGLLRPLRIGGVQLENNLVLAPMAGYSDVALRALCRRHGAGLVSTEMVAAPALEHAAKKAERRALTRPEERPVMVQIVGSDAAEAAAAARRVADRADLLSLNLGCPAHQVLATGCGAELLKRPEHAARLVSAIADATERPVVVKMRAGTDHVMDIPGIGKALEAAGAAAFILHARTAAQGYSGRADWALVARLKDAVSVPVIGNGDVRDGPDAAAALTASGADGVAIGRGALGDPRIFARIVTYLATGHAPAGATVDERLADFAAYLDLAGPHGIPLQQVRNQAVRFAHGFPGARDARVRLARAGSRAATLRILESAARPENRAQPARAPSPPLRQAG